MSLLPLRGETSAEPDEPQVLGLAGEDADEAFDVLSSSTTREVLSFVYDQPSTPAEIRDEIGTSLQNVHYHIDKLEDADLIEPAGTGYSEKGTEMTIYAPSNEAVVLFAGRQSDRSRLRQMLGRVFGVVFALAAGTLLYDRFLLDRVGDRTAEFAANDDGSGGASGGGDGGRPGAMDVTDNGSDGGTTAVAADTTRADGEDGIGIAAATPTPSAASTADSDPSRTVNRVCPGRRESTHPPRLIRSSARRERRTNTAPMTPRRRLTPAAACEWSPVYGPTKMIAST